MNVREILKLKDSVLFTVSPNAPIAEAIALMDENDIGAVVVIDGGEVVGKGTHEELLKTNETYREIVNSQIRKGDM